MTTFGVLVDFICSEFEFTQEELADYWNISVDLLKQWKNNRGYPKRKAKIGVEEIADIFLNPQEASFSIRDNRESLVKRFLEQVKNYGYVEKSISINMTHQEFVSFLKWFLHMNIQKTPTNNLKETDLYDIQGRLDKMEQKFSKMEAIIEEKSNQNNQIKLFLATLQDSAEYINKMEHLECQIFEMTIRLQELQKECERLRQMNQYSAREPADAISHPRSLEEMFSSVELAMSELEDQIENAIFENGDIWSILYDANLPQTEQTAEYLLKLTDSWDCYEIYDIFFERYAHLLSPVECEQLINKAKSIFMPEIYQEWNMESAYSLCTILANGLFEKDATESE